MSRPSLLAAAALVTFAAGCASTSEPRMARLAPAQDAPQHGDDHYVRRIEQMSRRQGISVIWVNPPRRAEPVQGAGGS